jgi:hypothetical protein
MCCVLQVVCGLLEEGSGEAVTDALLETLLKMLADSGAAARRVAPHNCNQIQFHELKLQRFVYACSD